jgi:hypothetical protein
MRTHSRKKNKKKKNTLMASNHSGTYQLMVTLCHTCEPTDKIRGALGHEGAMLHIKKRMIVTWNALPSASENHGPGHKDERLW